MFENTEEERTELPLLAIETHEGQILSVKAYKNYLLSTSRDKTCKIWDLATGQLKRTLSGHSSWVNKVEISDEFIVTGSYDGSILVWDGNLDGEWNAEPLFGIEGRRDHQQLFHLIKHQDYNNIPFLLVITNPAHQESDEDQPEQNHIINVTNNIQIWDLQQRKIISVFNNEFATATCSVISETLSDKILSSIQVQNEYQNISQKINNNNDIILSVGSITGSVIAWAIDSNLVIDESNDEYDIKPKDRLLFEFGNNKNILNGQFIRSQILGSVQSLKIVEQSIFALYSSEGIIRQLNIQSGLCTREFKPNDGIKRLQYGISHNMNAMTTLKCNKSILIEKDKNVNDKGQEEKEEQEEQEQDIEITQLFLGLQGGKIASWNIQDYNNKQPTIYEGAHEDESSITSLVAEIAIDSPSAKYMHNKMSHSIIENENRKVGSNNKKNNQIEKQQSDSDVPTVFPKSIPQIPVLFSAGSDGIVIAWDMRDGGILAQYPAGFVYDDNQEENDNDNDNDILDMDMTNNQDKEQEDKNHKCIKWIKNCGRGGIHMNAIRKIKINVV
ncbi:MAG: hypothetical protein EZS28_020965 [Streblomastix strix]|uniref:Uncharacterized protein n=1 Tax=Streblomastix strix TaxID=222440 RepID=A0A5J4VM34_9EUKA|nr:MAG: hypothetical protein EZS28_020965 [Streblomastix strix]